MAKRVPSQKWAKNKIHEIIRPVFTAIQGMNKAELEAIIETAVHFSETNCGWQSYWFKDIIVKVAEDQLESIPRESEKSLNA